MGLDQVELEPSEQVFVHSGLPKKKSVNKTDDR